MIFVTDVAAADVLFQSLSVNISIMWNIQRKIQREDCLCRHC